MNSLFRETRTSDVLTHIFQCSSQVISIDIKHVTTVTSEVTTFKSFPHVHYGNVSKVLLALTIPTKVLHELGPK